MKVPPPAQRPVLRGPLARLEPLDARHAEELWPLADDEGTWRFMSRTVTTRGDLQAWIMERLEGHRRGTTLPYLQRCARTGTAVGCTALFQIEARHRTAEVGHTWIGPAFRRTGINLDAKRLLLGHAFGPLGLERVQLKTDALNGDARASVESLGAVFEGVLRHHRIRPDGSHRDTAVYSILAGEWPAVESLLERRIAPHLPFARTPARIQGTTPPSQGKTLP